MNLQLTDSSSMYFNGTTSVSRYSNKCMQHKLNEKLNTFLENKKGKHNINVGFTIYLVHYNFTYCTVCYSHGHLAVLLRDHNIICKIYILKRWKNVIVYDRHASGIVYSTVTGLSITKIFSSILGHAWAKYEINFFHNWHQLVSTKYVH